MKALKKTLILLPVLLSVLALVGCNTPTDEITIWAWNKNVDIMNDAITRYKEIEPSFKAKVESLSHNDIDTKYATARELNNGALMGDIVLADAHKIRGQYYGFKKLFVDFNKYGVTDAHKANIVDSIIEIPHMDNKMMAMPFGIAPTVVFAYKPLWEQSVLDDIVANGWTWEDYDSYGEAIRNVHGNEVYMTSFNMRTDDRVYRTMVSQKGQWLMDKDLNIQVHNENSINALTRVKQLFDDELINHIDTGDYRVLMKNGKIAAQIQGFFLGGQLKDIAVEQSGNFIMLPIPRWQEDNRGDSVTGGSLLYVNDTIKQNKKAKAINFVKWIGLETENTLKALEIGGIYPALKTAYESEYFQTMEDPFFGNQKVYLDVANFSKEAPAIYPSKYNAFNYDAYILEQENVLFNNKDVTTALNDTKNKIANNAQK